MRDMDPVAHTDFEAFFTAAVGSPPFPYQTALATGSVLPSLLDVPTGLGKTEAAVLAWLWRRRRSDPATRSATPRRLVYCLPMRVLVAQTKARIEAIIRRLVASGSLGSGEIRVHVLMGGEDDSRWYENPEADAVLIGTQDMLLSRALNRGYGMSRYLWPVHFGWLHNDAFWVVDETQLMGPGLATTAQLAGLRRRIGSFGPHHTLWMSATLAGGSLDTVDHPRPPDGFSRLALGSADRTCPEVVKRNHAAKALRGMTIAGSDKNYASEIARLAAEGSRTDGLLLVVVNQVERAIEVFRGLRTMIGAEAPTALLHGRMRPMDRERHEHLLAAGTGRRVVVATQVVEAGVDVSASCLLTEIAPWPSLVQRFGRCNRRGEVVAAQIVVVDRALDVESALPYSLGELEAARTALAALGADASPDRLAGIAFEPGASVRAVLRRSDLLDLFDTTPDLMGADLDVSPYVRDEADPDVDVWWYEFSDRPPDGLPAPQAREICRVRISAFRDFLSKSAAAWQWSSADGEWRRVRAADVRPGTRILLPRDAGGYDDDLGWTGRVQDVPTLLGHPAGAAGEESLDDEHRSFGSGTWISLRKHSADVARHASQLVETLRDVLEAAPVESVRKAALWHDVGKAHPAFQTMLEVNGAPAGPQAKSPGRGGPARYRVPAGVWGNGMPPRDQVRPGFRHELVSALAWLSAHGGDEDADLVAYLVASHHGKVRTSIRSMPREARPPEADRRFARGVWDGDLLPEVELSPGERVPSTRLSLEIMEIGTSVAGPSWTERILRLREKYGPFRLAYLESLVRIADWRASAEYTS